MTEAQFKDWFENAVADSFMDLFFYDRKNDEDMPTELLAKCIEKGWLSEEYMKAVFIKQIEKEFE